MKFKRASMPCGMLMLESLGIRSSVAAEVVLYSSNDVETVNRVVEQFTKENPGIKVLVVRAVRNLEEAALSLARPLGKVLSGVTTPLVLSSVFSGALIVFAHVIGGFGVPAILGARTPVLAVKAYNEFVSEMGGNPTVASLLVFLGIGMLLIQKGIVERRQFQMESGRTPAPLTISGWRAKLAITCVLAVVGLSLLPTLVVTVTAITPSVGPVLQYGGFTLSHIQYALFRAPEPLFNSLTLATVVTVAGVLFSVSAAYLIVKRAYLLSRTLDGLVMLPLAVAGTVFGIALTNYFNSGWLVLTGSWLSCTSEA
ncbi:ABC transporter permease [Cupriavidus sp. USMAA2-4]|uniref:ABC transporter permease n=1 Tax=Cupriavidus sp. USMAA2-4 TaxID=876364 RepID=UPI000AB6F313|nr:hypothetical protein [Cupriavidus sp. USMAA2-4]